MKKVYPLFGILAPLLYLVAVIIGGSQLESYSHLYNTISEITASNVESIPSVQILFAIYNLFIIAFSVGMFLCLKTPNMKKIKTAALALFFVGLTGGGMYFFPQDPRFVEMTFGGKVHLGLASICSLLTMLSIILFGMGVKKEAALSKLRTYSYISFFIVFITGGTAAISVANDSDFGGLFERLTIGSYLQWVLVVSIQLFFLTGKPVKVQKPLV